MGDERTISPELVPRRGSTIDGQEHINYASAPLRDPKLKPSAYSLPVPQIRYRINLCRGRYRTNVGWFVHDRPFPLQVEENVLQEGAKPVFEIITTVKGGPRKAGARLTHLQPPFAEGIATGEDLFRQLSHSSDEDDLDQPTRRRPRPRYREVSRSRSRSSGDSDDNPSELSVVNFPQAPHPVTTFGDILIREIEETKVIVHSRYLIDFLRTMTDYYPQQSLTGQSVTIYEPFAFLLHHYREIESAARGQNSPPKPGFVSDDEDEVGRKLDERLAHLKLLLEFIEPRFNGTELKHLLELIEPQSRGVGLKQISSVPTPPITFQNLWYVFRPGDKIYFEDSRQGYKTWEYAVISEVHIEKKKGKETLRLRAWQLGCDGEYLWRSGLEHSIPKLQGQDEIDIADLLVVPEKLWNARDQGRRGQEILNRGKKIFQRLKQTHKELICSGMAAFAKPQSEVNRDPRGLPDPVLMNDEYLDSFKKFEGKVVLDIPGFSMFSRLHNPQQPNPLTDLNAPDMVMLEPVGTTEPTVDPSSPFSDYDKIDLQTTQGLSDDKYKLLIPLLVGYALGPKQWGIFDIESLHDIDRVVDPLANLVLEQKQLEFIRALSLQSGSTRPRWSADFVRGKGAGQIVMLHGPPGVGKTYTVECIAEYLARPLMSLTITDVGIEEISIEKHLQEIFALAERWKAILLIDEADIFLERRKAADIARNSIVSTFLRTTEYFSGTLFLTTNRVGQVDDAFISRAHIVLEYKALTDDRKTKIWEAFFAKLKKETQNRIIVGNRARKYLLEDAEIKTLQWNGREIRNALQTAITLAEFDASQEKDYDPEDPIILEEDHFSRVADMTRSFQDFLFVTHGQDELGRAKARRDRGTQ